MSFINVFDGYCVSKKYKVLEPCVLKYKNRVLEIMCASLRVIKVSENVNRDQPSSLKEPVIKK